MRITRAVVPSLFTVLNMFFGFYAIVSTHNSEFIPAIGFIILAAFFDAIDGVVARLLKSTSQFGVEIDSLSDVVSFGVAPAFLAYTIALHELNGVGMFLSSLLMVFGGIRLARFNVQTTGFEKTHFTGLPIPASAMTVCSFIYLWYDPASGLHPVAKQFLPYLVVVLSLLMVSRVRYEALPKISKKSIRKEPFKFTLFLLALIIVLATRGDALFPVLILFILIGLVRHAWHAVKTFFSSGTKDEGEEEAEVGSVDV